MHSGHGVGAAAGAAVLPSFTAAVTLTLNARTGVPHALLMLEETSTGREATMPVAMLHAGTALSNLSCRAMGERDCVFIVVLGIAHVM
jgi:hypothetical protein